MSMNFRRCAARAIHIRDTLGIRRAAGYLRNEGVSLEEALFILL